MFSTNNEELIYNKVLLLYILDKSPFYLNKYEITELILEKNYLDYFSCQQYLSELISTDFIELINIDDKMQYRLLKKGHITLKHFSNRIPDKVRIDFETKFNSLKIQKKKENQVLSEYFQRDDGQFTVNLRLVENDINLFSLYLTVSTKKQAELISNSWKEKTNSIYSETIKLLIE